MSNDDGILMSDLYAVHACLVMYLVIHLNLTRLEATCYVVLNVFPFGLVICTTLITSTLVATWQTIGMPVQLSYCVACVCAPDNAQSRIAKIYSNNISPASNGLEYH